MPQVVVAAAVLDDDGRLLAARRSAPADLAGRWELPGGKVHDGESDEAALVRECREELGVTVAIGTRVGADWPLAPGVVMRVWRASVVSGTPQPLQDHSELRWLPRRAWHDVAWLPGDTPVITALESG